MAATPAFDALTATFTRLHRYQHLAAMAGWDQAAMMPPKGNEARAAALAELDMLMHRTLCDSAVAQHLQAAAAEELDEAQEASLREMRRHWRQAVCVPQALVQAQSLAGTRCEHAWRSQRPAQDWAGFAPNLREVVALARQEARLRADATGLAPYDALMDKFEPGMRASRLDALFGEIKTWLPRLTGEAAERQRSQAVRAPQPPFDVAAQRALGLEIMTRLGFDFEGGRLDVSAHPFCGGVPEDVRITTRYSEQDFIPALMGVVHETGHARYEQGLARAQLHLPVGRARSMGIHESQSLSMEMQLARSPAFCQLLAPLLHDHLGAQPAFGADNLARLFTRVRPGFIRVEADELSYPSHVILRYELERALIEGAIEVDELPGLWDEKMMASLGLDTRGRLDVGCMQDIHWPCGMFGYFPSYTLGAMYAAQFFAAMRRQMPDLDARVAGGDLAPVFDWLGTHVWRQASRWSTDELVTRATGEALNPVYLRQHLQTRYLAD